MNSVTDDTVEMLLEVVEEFDHKLTIPLWAKFICMTYRWEGSAWKQLQEEMSLIASEVLSEE